MDDLKWPGLQGSLTDEQFALVDLRRVSDWLNLVVKAQPHEKRDRLRKRNKLHVRLSPFDAAGYTGITLFPENSELVRIHWTQLVEGEPFEWEALTYAG